MSSENFVILILCQKATLDDVVEAREKYDAVVVNILNYDNHTNYFDNKKEKFDGLQIDLKLLFVFGNNDSLLVRNDADTRKVTERLKSGHC